ncbi:MAG TPA: glycerol-3-phosphate acyltransferase, partial [Methylomirabilota bacterium]|nr:glycerol-3-phosphate acyltransferase [Methylomirabilota bacterium]
MYSVAIAVAYLVGSISFPYAIARLNGVDLRASGSRKLGGSNLMRTVGLVPGVVGGVLDAAKGFAAVTLARALG